MFNTENISLNGNVNFSNAKLAEGTNSATIQTAAAIDYTIGGLFYSKAGTDNIAMTACASQAAGTTCMYLIKIDTAGAITITKGTEVTTGSALPLPYPSSPSSAYCVIGLMKIANATNPFVCGTTDLSASGVTATFYNLATPPTSVQLES